jgi:hypothetical protein
MTGIVDLAPCHYLSSSDHLLAIGWLDRNLDCRRGPTPSRVFAGLVELLANPFMPVATAGTHICNLCQFEDDAPVGHRYLLVPSGKFIYAAPELILHYINAHWYQPPAEFCDAVITCPAMRSPQYREALALGGVAKMFRS